jgi:hypothetical protein
LANYQAKGRSANPLAGRQKGTPNKVPNKTRLVEAAHAAGLETPLDFLLRVMRDERRDMDMRLIAARAAVPYMHPALKSIEVAGPGGGAIEFKVTLAFD